MLIKLITIAVTAAALVGCASGPKPGIYGKIEELQPRVAQDTPATGVAVGAVAGVVTYQTFAPKLLGSNASSIGKAGAGLAIGLGVADLVNLANATPKVDVVVRNEHTSGVTVEYDRERKMFTYTSDGTRSQVSGTTTYTIYHMLDGLPEWYCDVINIGDSVVVVDVLAGSEAFKETHRVAVIRPDGTSCEIGRGLIKARQDVSAPGSFHLK